MVFLHFCKELFQLFLGRGWQQRCYQVQDIKASSFINCHSGVVIDYNMIVGQKQ
jgi:hypothetical protein